MAFLKPILQCLVDQEPTAFHTSDANGETYSFAVNLSLDCRGDGTAPADIQSEELAARQQYLKFFTAALKVEFHLFEVIGPGGKLEYAGPVHSTSGSLTTEKVSVLHDWLGSQKPAAGPDRYWTSVPSSETQIVVDADDVIATHRLRAAHSWNAPVAHRFGLTHVVRVARDRIAAGQFLILPYFEHLTGSPDELTFEQERDGAVDYAYNPLGGLWDAIGRTNLIGEGITKPFSPVEIDSGFDDNGYIQVDSDADNVRRVLVWLEERSGSLMTANSGLLPHETSDEDIKAFEQMFGMRHCDKVPIPGKPDEFEFYWTSKEAAWYVATRLISTLDNLVIALLKPVSPGARVTEGPVLAPFVTALIARIKEETASDELVALPELVDGTHLTGVIRGALRTSPLLLGKDHPPHNAPADPARLVQALRHVYGLSSLPKVLDESALITAILEGFVGNPAWKIDTQHVDYLNSLVDKSGSIIARKLTELEQVLHDEAGAEKAIVRLVETVAMASANKELSALIAEAFPNQGDLRSRIQRAAETAWADYRAMLDDSFHGVDAVRHAVGSTFVLGLLSFKERLKSTFKKSAAPSKKQYKEWKSSEFLCWIVRASAFYERRFFLLKQGPDELKILTDALLTPDVSVLPDATQSALRLQLRIAFYAAVEPLKAFHDLKARFIPDSTPQPLPIQIAGNIDGSKIDDFGKHFNGIGVVIQRVDSGTATDPWAHANLADLGWQPLPKPQHPDDPQPDDPIDVKGAIHPMLPAISDGRSPMFIEYQGFPFSDRAIDARIVDNGAAPRNDKLWPFYRHDPHIGNDFANVPRLAYGRTFKTFSFLTSNAGTLPLALQLGPDSPWMPNPAPPPPGSDDPVTNPLLVGRAPYQRRTAIAQMAVIEQTAKGRAPRIGAEIPGVTPLARDYPRIVLLAEPNEPAVRDFLREPDGRGTMAATQNDEWRLSDIKFDGVPTKLTLHFFDRPAQDPTDDGDATFEVNEETAPGFTAISEIAIGIEFKPKKQAPPERWLHVRCGETPLAPKQLSSDGDSVAGWLRLVLDDSVYHERVTMTFANVGSQKSDNVNDPLLLLAPNDRTAWKDRLSDDVTIKVSTPRVGYLDFERWFANADLRKAAFSRSGEDPAVAKSVELFEQALITAYVMRHLDSGLAASLDRMPDPAVDQIRIAIAPLDTLTDPGPTLGDTQQTYSIQKDSTEDRLYHFASGFTQRVGEMIAKEGLPWPGKDLSRPWTPLRLRKYLFDPLDKVFQFKVVISSSESHAPSQDPQPARSLSLSYPSQDPNDLPKFWAAVPEGVVARLSIDALVPAKYFESTDALLRPSVFNAGLKQYALRKLSEKYLAFPSAAVRVETMYDGIKEIAKRKVAWDSEKFNQVAIELAESMIAVEGIERTRRYDLMTNALVPGETATRHWRLLGEIDVTTQRWRTTGRPIYHHVNPRRYRFGGASDEAKPLPFPALRLDLGADAKGELARFESEAFFNRLDIDAQTITKTLEPLPARTTLQQIFWNPDSATYFRHRFRLRSRYAGALKSLDKSEVIAWPEKDPKAPEDAARTWTMRVAMLADLANVKMTRPQLRALIPLTTAPGGDEVNRTAPPVAAILQEPPFARGGLADRIASEVKTGFSYGFTYDERTQAPDDTHHLEILDSRKEGGPDPRLDYRRLNEATALGLVLRSEGPIGLTFDNIDAPAPAYPNAMFSLLPATLNGDSASAFEEMFVGVAMRRYIDPAWTTEPSQPDCDSEGKRIWWDGERCWWIVPSDPGDLPVDLLSYSVPGVVQPFALLDLKQTSSHIEVRASRLAIDGVGPSETNPDGDLVAILKLDRTKFAGLAVLHQPVAPGRYSASVFVTTKSANTERGEMNSPLMLASFEWSPPVKDDYGRPKPVSATVNGLQMSAYLTLASAPTFVRWTRTNRDADFLHLPRIDNDAWKVDRPHVRDLVATLDGDHFSFKLNGVDNPIWIRPSTFANSFPIHVHRHLAVISSYFLKELGRSAELFCRTALARGKQAMLVAPDGSAVDLSKTTPPDQTVRVVEFETPAQILCDKNITTVPDKYRKAYFDLLSTGFDKDEAKSISMHFYFRIVGPPAHQRVFTGLKIHLPRMVDAKETDQASIPLTWTNQPQSFVVGVYLTLKQKAKDNAHPAADPLPAIEARLLRSDGTLDPAQNFAAVERIEDDGVFVSVDATAPAGHEFWTDVSLLHSTGEAANTRLDFDWLFSSPPPAGQDDEPAVSVSPDRLNLLYEAQARVISVTSPIPIKRP